VEWSPGLARSDGGRAASTLGKPTIEIPTPTGLRPVRRDATPLGLLVRYAPQPRVAATRQPWAGDRSPVGAEDSPEVHDGLLLPLVLPECQKEVGNRQLGKGDYRGCATSKGDPLPQKTRRPPSKRGTNVETPGVIPAFAGIAGMTGIAAPRPHRFWLVRIAFCGFILQMARTPAKLIKLPGSARTGTVSFEGRRRQAAPWLTRFAVPCNLFQKERIS
jgi:hypothetical protein